MKTCLCRFLKKVSQIWGAQMLIFKIRGTHVNPLFSRLYIYKFQKKLCPRIFWKVFLFMNAANGIILINFFQLVCVRKRKNSIFQPKIGLGQPKCTNRFSVEILIRSLGIWKNFISVAVRHSSKLFKVEKRD